jgi:hypothetical protein
MSRGITYSHARHFFTALIDHANDAALIDPSVLGEVNRNENGMRPSFGERWKCLPMRAINRKAVALNGKEVLRHLRYDGNLSDNEFYQSIKTIIPRAVPRNLDQLCIPPPHAAWQTRGPLLPEFTRAPCRDVGAM